MGFWPLWIPGGGSPDPGVAEPGAAEPATPGIGADGSDQGGLFPDTESTGAGENGGGDDDDWGGGGEQQGDPDWGSQTPPSE